MNDVPEDAWKRVADDEITRWYVDQGIIEVKLVVPTLEDVQAAGYSEKAAHGIVAAQRALAEGKTQKEAEVAALAAVEAFVAAAKEAERTETPNPDDVGDEPNVERQIQPEAESEPLQEEPSKETQPDGESKPSQEEPSTDPQRPKPYSTAGPAGKPKANEQASSGRRKGRRWRH
jgi:hypothetical protein